MAENFETLPVVEAVPDSARTRLGPFILMGRLGRGGMGEVFQVWEENLRRPVALKVVRPETMTRSDVLARFLQEARITAQLKHPGVIPVFSLGALPDGRPFYTMEVVSGRTFRDVIREINLENPGDSTRVDSSQARPLWTFRRLIDIFRNVCEITAFAHSQGVIHRDLTPNNIMVGAFGEVRILDWGLARRIDPETGLPRAEETDWPDFPSISDARPDNPAMRNLEPVLNQSRAAETSGQGDLTQKRAGEAESGGQGDSGPTPRGRGIEGTPAYLAPEQAMGQTDLFFPTADVYALGAILYEILSGSPPYQGSNVWEIVGQLRAGPPPPPRRVPISQEPQETLMTGMVPDGNGSYQVAYPGTSTTPPAQPGPQTDEELEAICLKAMARDPARRYANAGLLARDIEAWLDGARRREQALAIVAEADQLKPQVLELNARAGALAEQTRVMLDSLGGSAPVEERDPAWRLEDQAEELKREARLREADYVQRLHAALMHEPDLPEASSKLADFYKDQHAQAESKGDERLAAHAQALLRMYDRGQHAAYLRGDGALTLVTEPPGVEARLYRYELKNRRLVPHFVRNLGRTPLNREPLPMGSYLVTLEPPGGSAQTKPSGQVPDHQRDVAPVRYPVFIGRQQHWDGIPPGGTSPLPIRLPTVKELGPEDIYIPAGWFQCGYEGLGAGCLPRAWMWVDSFVIRRFPVTNREYLAFLNDLLARGQEEQALRHAPRETSGTASEQGAIIYGRDVEGRFVLRTDAWGMAWLEEYPVHMIDWFDATAYAAWEAERSGLPWRLSRELEWEKAARGVDGRLCPWGDYPEADWTRGCRRGARASVAVVDSYPFDESPCGVRGMGGNVRDWCEDPFQHPRRVVEEAAVAAEMSNEGEIVYRVIRGGCWQSSAVHLGLVARFLADGISRYYEIGFRLARSMPGPETFGLQAPP